jgi:hypothetical protein
VALRPPDLSPRGRGSARPRGHARLRAVPAESFAGRKRVGGGHGPHIPLHGQLLFLAAAVVIAVALIVLARLIHGPTPAAELVSLSTRRLQPNLSASWRFIAAATRAVGCSASEPSGGSSPALADREPCPLADGAMYGSRREKH